MPVCGELLILLENQLFATHTPMLVPLGAVVMLVAPQNRGSTM